MISLCSFVKDEAHCVKGMMDSVSSHVNEIVIVDTGSTDGTQDICREYGARVYEIGFSDFGKIRTITAHLANEPWVIMLDADERIDKPDYLQCLCIRDKDKHAYAFPRKRWLDLEKTKQTELDAYPDYQVRLFRNNSLYVWKREVHEYFSGCAVENLDPNDWRLTPHIDHFHDIYKSPERLQERNQLYTRLAAQAGVSIEGGKKLEGT